MLAPDDVGIAYKQAGVGRVEDDVDEAMGQERTRW